MEVVMYELTDADFLAAWQKLAEAAKDQRCLNCGGDSGHAVLTHGNVASLGGEAELRKHLPRGTYCIAVAQKP
jgi:hypothetical protein